MDEPLGGQEVLRRGRVFGVAAARVGGDGSSVNGKAGSALTSSIASRAPLSMVRAIVA